MGVLTLYTSFSISEVTAIFLQCPYQVVLTNVDTVAIELF